MTESNQPQNKQSLRSPDFRYVPCDSISLGLGNNGVKLLLGVEELDGTTLELVGIHLTHRTALFLKKALKEAIEHYEKETGEEIETLALNSADTARKTK